MPRGRPRKNPETVRVASEDAPAVLAAVVEEAVTAVREMAPAPDPLADLKVALGAAITADPEGTRKALADVLEVSHGGRRTVEDRVRKVPLPKSALEIKMPEVKEEPPGVIFASPHQAFRQVLIPSQKKYYGDGNVDIIPAVIAEFEQGQVRLTDADQIAAMRAKIRKKEERGIPPQVVEMRDEIAEAMAANGHVLGVKAAVASQTTTVYDKLPDLVQ